MAVTGEGRVQIEPADTLFLHPSDHPGQAPVTDIFNGDDYENWRRTVRIALSAKQKIPIIDGTYANLQLMHLCFLIGKDATTWYFLGY